jgi:hypothetical protein
MCRHTEERSGQEAQQHLVSCEGEETRANLQQDQQRRAPHRTTAPLVTHLLATIYDHGIERKEWLSRLRYVSLLDMKPDIPISTLRDGGGVQCAKIKVHSGGVPAAPWRRGPSSQRSVVTYAAIAVR